MKRNKLALRHSLQCVRWIMAFGLIIALSQDAASQDRRVSSDFQCRIHDHGTSAPGG